MALLFRSGFGTKYSMADRPWLEVWYEDSLYGILLWTNTHERTVCKGLVLSLCNHTSVVWYDAWPASHGWVQSSSGLLHGLWWKCTTSAECKTNRLAVLTVKSGLDPHMIIKLKDGLKLCSLVMIAICLWRISYLMLNVGWYKLILY
jgi:hypothetical protein